MKKGLIHLYTGEGKGKTTAALGLLLRAFGRGKRVVLVQLLKGRETGELFALEKLGITVLRLSRDFGFYQSVGGDERAEIRRQNDANLMEAFRLAKDGFCDVLVLDEICAAHNMGAVDRVLVENLVSDKPPALELVLTGRDAPALFTRAADYITECTNHRHPYDKGVAAREGIEF